MSNMAGEILKSVGGGGILGGIGNALVDGDKQKHEDELVKTIAAAQGGKPPSFKKGTDRVPKTGPAILHKDEAVLPKDDADKYRAGKSIYDLAAGHMGGDKKEETPAKKLKEMRIRKAHGGHVVEHHHEHPEVHPMEEHIAPDMKSLHDHLEATLGEPQEAMAAAGQPDNEAAEQTKPQAQVQA